MTMSKIIRDGILRGEKAIKILNNLKMCMLPLNIYELDKRTRELKSYPEIVKLVEKLGEKLGKLSFKK